MHTPQQVVNEVVLPLLTMRESVLLCVALDLILIRLRKRATHLDVPWSCAFTVASRHCSSRPTVRPFRFGHSVRLTIPLHHCVQITVECLQ